MNNLVQLTWVEKTIAIVQMQDKETKNTLGLPLITDLTQILNQIKNQPEAKVVILKGLEGFFCSGLAEAAFVRFLLDCELPTIAAMQGNATGAGFTLGVFADVMILAEESSYGHPQGGLETYILPKKFGSILGAEFLYTSELLTGAELKARNLSVRIVKKSEVDELALSVAQDFNEKPAVSLKLLKKHLTKEIKDELALWKVE